MKYFLEKGMVMKRLIIGCPMLQTTYNPANGRSQGAIFESKVNLNNNIVNMSVRNSYVLKETSAIYSKEYIADVGNLKELKNAYAAGIEIMKQTKLQVERYEELTLEQKKKLYIDLNRFICAISV